MKAIIAIPTEVDLKYVKIVVAVRYDVEDMPADFPGRKNDIWTAVVDLDTHCIQDWPENYLKEPFKLDMKVLYYGSYYLCDNNMNVILEIEEDNAPNSLIPGRYGDYIALDIDKTGVILNWLKNPSIEDFQ